MIQVRVVGGNITVDNLRDQPINVNSRSTLELDGDVVTETVENTVVSRRGRRKVTVIMANVTIYTIPLGSQFTASIAQDEPESKNDFDVLLLWDENVDLAQSGVSVSLGSIVAFEGANSVYKVTIRPPETAGVVTLTVNQNAVSEGNAETSKDIRVSTDFPDDDAEIPTSLFNHNLSGSIQGMSVSATRIFFCNSSSSGSFVIESLTHNGVHQSSETIMHTQANAAAWSMDYINGSFLISFYRSVGGGAFHRAIRTSASGFLPQPSRAITHTRLGITSFPNRDTVVFQPYNLDEEFTEVEVDIPLAFTAAGQFPSHQTHIAAHHDDLLYLYRSRFVLAAITDDNDVEVVARLNITRRSSNNSGFRDIAIFRDTLYLLDATGVHTLDIRKYRPVAKRTKTTIYPVFANEGDTIDLTQFSPDAERIVFDVGYRKPPFLSINNANNEIRVAASAVSSTTPVFVRCLGINRIDSQPFSFYLVIRQAASPAWRELTRLSMRANSSYNMFQIVDGADSVVFRSGRTQPPGSSLANGVFSIGTSGGQVSLTARKGSQTAHTEFEIDVVQDPDPANFSDTFRHTVEIAGIDVTADVEAFPVVSKSLDSVALNEYRADTVSLSLKSGSTNNYKYNDDVADNFWTTHGLNPGGFQVPIRIYIESLVNGNYISHLLFAGVIDNSKANFNNTLVELRCLDISRELERTLVQAFGTLEKWDTLRQKSDENNFQGVYTPEASLLPMQIGNAEAWSHRQRLTIRQLAIPSEGPPIPNSAYITPTEFFTSGGLLDENPIVKFKTHHRSEDVRFLINQIAL